MIGLIEASIAVSYLIFDCVMERHPVKNFAQQDISPHMLVLNRAHAYHARADKRIKPSR